MQQDNMINYAYRLLYKHNDKIKYNLNPISVPGMVAHFYTITNDGTDVLVYLLVDTKRIQATKYRLCITKNGQKSEYVGDVAGTFYNKVREIYMKHLDKAGKRRKNDLKMLRPTVPPLYITSQRER